MIALFTITFKGSPIVGSIPVDRETADWVIRQLARECPARREDYDVELHSMSNAVGASVRKLVTA